MTDCELLELAAKAAGYSLSAASDMIWSDAAVEYIPWNPLTDDGDARLNGLAGRITGALNVLAEDQVKGGES